MIDTRNYTIISSSSSLATVIEENSSMRRVNTYLVGIVVVVSLITVILTYQNMHLGTRKDEEEYRYK